MHNCYGKKEHIMIYFKHKGVYNMARKGTMNMYTIESEFLQENMNIKVYEPEQYDAIYERQICIMQDGDDYFNMGRVATVSDRLHEEDELINTIFVGIHYMDREDRWRKYYPLGDQHEAYKNFLLKEVLPFLEALLPIHPLGTTYSLMGDSLAATFALILGTENPNTFSSIILQSPLVDEPVLNIVEDVHDFNQLTIYHSIGLQEDAVITTKDEGMDFIEPNKQLHALLQKRNNDYTYTEIDVGNHTWKHWQKELPDVLTHILG